MKALVNNLVFGGLGVVLSFSPLRAPAQQSPMELSCRTKAKEIAAQTYNSCMTDARAAQIEKIRKDYQKQLTELKAKYDRELKKLKASGSTEASPAKTSKPKAPKGLVKTLPTRKEVPTPAAPMGAESVTEKAVVTQETPDTTSSLEAEMPQNDAPSDFNMELKPAPLEREDSSTTSGEVF